MGKWRSGDTPMHGRDVAARWLAALDLRAVPRWHVEVTLGDAATRFLLNVYAEEWGFAFHHDHRSSWIRVTDIPFVHGRDDFGLLASVPDLLDMGAYLAELEAAHGITLPRASAEIRTNVEGAVVAVRRWLARSR